MVTTTGAPAMRLLLFAAAAVGCAGANRSHAAAPSSAQPTPVDLSRTAMSASDTGKAGTGKPLERLRMRRIDPPQWARTPKTIVDSRTAHAYFQPRLAEVERALHDELVEYVNDPQRTAQDGAEGFPRRDKLSGDYYLGDTRYHEDPQFLWMTIRLHALDRAGDRYLGIEAFAGLDRQSPDAGWVIEGFEQRAE